MALDEDVRELARCYDEHKDALKYRNQTSDQDEEGKYISYCCLNDDLCPYYKKDRCYLE